MTTDQPSSPDPTAGTVLGEGGLGEETVAKAVRAYGGDGTGGSHCGAWPYAMRNALAAVLPDLLSAAREAGRAEGRVEAAKAVERLYSNGRPGACACPFEDQRECGYRKGIGDAVRAAGPADPDA